MTMTYWAVLTAVMAANALLLRGFWLMDRRDKQAQYMTHENYVQRSEQAVVAQAEFYTKEAASDL